MSFTIFFYYLQYIFLQYLKSHKLLFIKSEVPKLLQWCSSKLKFTLSLYGKITKKASVKMIVSVT